MGEDRMDLSQGTIYINSTEYVGEGLTDYDYRDYEEATTDYIKSNMFLCKNASGEIECRLKVNRMFLIKIMGIWDWVLENCPNGRVKHLMRQGKNERVRYKNFKRAVHLISKNVKEK